MFSAETTISQMGGIGRLSAMVKARDFVKSDEDRYIKFRFSSCRKANICQIFLAADDTYTVVFHKLRGLDCKEVRRVEGVYCDMLVEVFEGFTGLYLSL